MVEMVDRHLNPQLSQRMPQEIMDKLDAYAADRGVSRTKIVNDAALFYVSSKECIKCGALNHPEGKKCAVCGTELYSDEELSTIVDRFLEGVPPGAAFSFIESHFPERAEYLEKFLEKGYQPHFYFFIDRKSGETKYHIRLTFRDGELDFTPTGVIIQNELDSDTLLSFMASEVTRDMKISSAQQKKKE